MSIFLRMRKIKEPLYLWAIKYLIKSGTIQKIIYHINYHFVVVKTFPEHTDFLQTAISLKTGLF